MKRFSALAIFAILILFPHDPFAQKIKIDQIVKENKSGGITACGLEFVATDGKANGIQMQTTLYSLGNLNWDFAIHIIAGHTNEKKEFVQENLINASVHSSKISEIPIIYQGRYMPSTPIKGDAPSEIIENLLRYGFAVSFQTEQNEKGYIEIAASEEKLKEFKEGCYQEMQGMVREHYRDFHGTTECLDNPNGC